ncbi:MAG: TIGR03013 family XrtA/PEP-CTERM system glycosyltransferase [Pseudomonadota bacterium]
MFGLLAHHYHFRKMLLLTGEGVGICAALVAGVLLRVGDASYITEGPFLFCLKVAVVVVVGQAILFLSNLYEFEEHETQVNLLARVLNALALTVVALALVYFVVPELLFGRGIFLLAFTLVSLLTVSWRSFYLWLMNSRTPQRNVLFMGSGDLAREIAKEILSRKDAGINVAGFLTRDPSRVGQKVLSPSIIGTCDQVCQIAERCRADKVIIALRERRGLPVDDLLKCKMKGIQVVDGFNFFEQLTGKLLVGSLKPSYFIFSEGFIGSRTGLLAKRVLDLAFSSLLLLASAPLMILIALLIKIDSPGAVLFRQERVGEWGRGFRIAKFRSMYEDAEAASGPVWASEDDPRVTSLGKLLRRYRLDELPQLWNVLSGRMSLVGPRPERPYFVEQLRRTVPYYDQRFLVKPGITGWAQVRYSYGSSEEDALEKLKYDLYYIKHNTVWLDLVVFFETVRIVLFGRGSR